MNTESITLFEDTARCCGCEACVNVCPVSAISMSTDDYGYEYPVIDHDKCLKCGLCEKVCQYKNSCIKSETEEAFAAASNDDRVLMSTASGGLFTSIAGRFIENGGIVYGSSMYNSNGEIDPSHIRVTDFEGLELLKGSKYVQSSIGDTYTKAKNDLDSGNRVLFSGTPCQIAGLKLFLRKDYLNLYTIDIICHGVPGKKFFMDFLEHQGKIMNGKVKKFVFRDKSKGQGQTARLTISDGSKNKEYVTNGKLLSYFGLFLKQETYRDSCYECMHTSCERNGDITLGDYWGIYIEHGKEVSASHLSNTKGISCVLINSEKGQSLLAGAKDNLNLLESSFEKVSKHNDQLREPSKHTDLRKTILELYKNDGYQAVDKCYKRVMGVKKYLYLIEFIMPKELKRTLKTIAHKISS